MQRHLMALSGEELCGHQTEALGRTGNEGASHECFLYSSGDCSVNVQGTVSKSIVPFVEVDAPNSKSIQPSLKPASICTREAAEWNVITTSPRSSMTLPSGDGNWARVALRRNATYETLH